MNGTDLDTLLDGFTDAQIKAYLSRRAMARDEKRRLQTAARMNALRARHRDAEVTQAVTQQNGNSPSNGDAGRDAEVTQAVTRTVTHTLAAASPMVSPVPPSFPAPTHTPARGGGKNGTPKPETVPIPELLAKIERFAPTWAQFIESRRLIGEPMTYLAAERLLERLAKRPDDAVDGVNMAIEKQWQGFNWKWFDNENAEPPTRKTGTSPPTGLRRPAAIDMTKPITKF